MGKTTKQYKELFEDLMEYTDFKSSDDIETNEDLYEFFRQVKGNSKSEGRNFRISKLLFSKVRDVVSDRREIIQRKIEGIKESRKIFSHFTEAKKEGLTAYVNKIEIYKSYTITINKHRIVRWRDNKGRFARTPK